ncbi:MAG: hypothetical protein FWE40_04265 [Oscillospiraceae bacterium]|nr:hypothetical protein [Oscillospiraceae bacterium]
MISSALMKEQLKRFWPFMLFSALAYTLFVALPVLVQHMTPAIADLFAMRNTNMLALTVAVPFVITLLLFSFLFKPRATEAFYAFTSSKNQLFWTNAAAGFVLIAVPLALSSLLLLVDGTFAATSAFFLRVLVSQVFMYALFLFGASLSGNWVVTTFIAGLLTAAPLLLHRLGLLIGEFYVTGYAPVNPMQPMTLLSYFNPLAWQFNWNRLAQPIYYLIYLGIALVLLGLASTCFAARKIEKAENTIVFSTFKNVMIFLLSIVGMIAMGGLMINLFTGRWFLYYGFVLGFAIAFCVLQIIFEKNFNIKNKVKQIMPLAGVIAVLYGIMLLVTMFGMRGFVQYVPNQARIAYAYVNEKRVEVAEAVEIHEIILDAIDTRSDLTRDQRRDMSGSERRDHNSDRRDVRSDMRDTHWQAITGGGRQFEEDGGQWLTITYVMQNGDRMYRRYALSVDFMLSSGIAELLADEDALTPYEALANPGDITAINLRFGGEFPIEFTLDNAEEIAALATVLRQDIADDAASGYEVIVRMDIAGYGAVNFVHAIGAHMGAMMEQMM